MDSARVQRDGFCLAQHMLCTADNREAVRHSPLPCTASTTLHVGLSALNASYCGVHALPHETDGVKFVGSCLAEAHGIELFNYPHEYDETSAT